MRTRIRTTIALAVLLLLSAYTCAFGSNVIHVKTTGLDTADGLTWATAKKTVQAGLTASVAGDEVWVAAGTYQERLTMKLGVAVYGGFAGGEASQDQRPSFPRPAPDANETIIDAKSLGCAVTMPANATPITRLDGFTVRKGYNSASTGGSGIYCADHSSPVIANNIISECYSRARGAGICCENGSSPTITANILRDNSAGILGGAVSCVSSSPTISGNTIIGNSASSDGTAISMESGSSVVVSRNMMSSNKNETRTHAALVCIDSSLTLLGNTISTNTGDGVSISSAAGVVIANNVILGNSGYGVVGSVASSPSVVNNTIVGNVFGGIKCLGSPGIANNIIAFNPVGITNSGGSPVLAWNDVYNPDGRNYVGLSAGVSDISADPLFVAYGYGRAHLRADSPCIDAGDDVAVEPGWLDVDGESRISGTGVDIGADEWSGVAHSFSPTVFRVSTQGSDLNDGSSWASAKKTVQAALDAASVVGGEVWVAGGTYSGPVSLRNFAFLYGGFAGTENARDERDWNANVSCISGGAAIVAARYCGYRLNGVDGVVINRVLGGSVGISCYKSGPVIRHNRITNTAGGIELEKSSALIIDNIIEASASSSTGGIRCELQCPVIRNNTITGNSGVIGGIGLYDVEYATIADNIVAGNTGRHPAGGIYLNGSGGEITNNTIVGNNGAGIEGVEASASISNNIVAFNSFGITNSQGSLMLHNNVVYNPGGPEYSGLAAGEQDISVDPGLVSYEYANVHLRPGSPCRDAGSNAVVGADWVDMDGQARIQPIGGIVDIGADECDGTDWAPGPYAMIHVTPNGDDANDGLTWDRPKKTIQAAVDSATALRGEVWVAAGIYPERVMLGAYSHLYGGFFGTESALGQRDWKINRTVICSSGSSYGVVAVQQAGLRLSRVDGFTITVPTGYSNYGIYCLYASPIIAHNTVTKCSTSGSRSGVYCSYSHPLITGNVISHNWSTFGGGIYLEYSQAVVEQNLITGNHSTYGGGVYSFDNASTIPYSPTIRNNIISGNGAELYGGGIHCEEATIENNTVVGNNAFQAGGIQCQGQVRVTNNIVAFNSSGIRGLGAQLNRNLVYNPDGLNYSGITPGADDISVDPELVAWEFGQMHLRHDSPCVDSGDDTGIQSGWMDIDGEPRVQGAHVDIGADESDGSTPAFAPDVVRVSPNGDDTQDGSSWVLAKKTIQSAVDAASVVGGEVWVAAGAYNEAVTLWPYAYVYGGFAGTEPTRDDRDWKANVSVIDGNGIAIGVNAYAGYLSGCIDGFTIRRGTGVNCVAGAITIANNIVCDSRVASTTGAGIRCESASCRILGNTVARITAGGLYLSKCSPLVQGNTITGNRGSGGISCQTATPVILGNTISGNYAEQNGGGILGTSMVVANNIIAGNTSGWGYSGLRCESSAVVVNNTIVGNELATNTYADKGCVYCVGAATVANNIIAFNTAGISCPSGSESIRNNCLYGNALGDFMGTSSGVGNIIADPKLVSMEFGRLGILPGSPCIDAGDDALVHPAWLDRDGQARISGTHVDIGAYEFRGRAASTRPTIVRVSRMGSDDRSHDGSSWAMAKRTIQAGIDALSDIGGEVWVAAGTYEEHPLLPAFVHLYGGFAGTESSRAQRSIGDNATTVDGGGSGPTVVVTGGNLLNTVDGFSIRNGGRTASGTSYPGGGIVCYASTAISNNTITDSVAGIYNLGRSPLIQGNTIVGNHGTGLTCYGGCSVIADNLISLNEGYGISSFEKQCTISNNAIKLNNGGVGCTNSSGSAVIAGNTIADNTVGQAVTCYGTAPAMVNNTIVGNATSSGCVVSVSSGATVSNNIVAFNSGGFTFSPSPVFRNNLVFNPGGTDYSGTPIGSGNVSVDPLLVNRLGGDYHLSASSPCLNAGWNDAPGFPLLDIDGEARVYGSAVDIGADESWPSSLRLQEAKSILDTARCTTTDVVVTAVFGGFFYIEAGNRSMGIRVEKVGHGLEAGAKVSITGALKTNADGERYIEAVTVTQTGSGSIDPLHINSRALGGVDWLYNASTGAGQKGVVGGLGLNNIGILVTTWGKLSYLGGGFSLSDTKIDAAKVVVDGMKTAGLETYVQITGVVSCYKDAEGLHPTILATEITPVR